MNINSEYCDRILSRLKRNKVNSPKYNEAKMLLADLKEKIEFKEIDNVTPYQKLINSFLKHMANKFFAQEKGGNNWYSSYFIGIIKLVLKYATEPEKNWLYQ